MQRLALSFQTNTGLVVMYQNGYAGYFWYFDSMNNILVMKFRKKNVFT